MAGGAPGGAAAAGMAGSPRPAARWTVPVRNAGGRVGVAVVSAIVLLLLLGGYYFMGTPYYSLLRMMRAMQQGDAAGVSRFVDVDRLSAHIVAEQADQVARARGTGRNDWDRMQNDVQARFVQTNSAALLQYVDEQIRTALSRIGTTPGPASGGAWGFKGITYNGDEAHVEVARKTDGQVVGFDMQRQPDRTWKIVRVDLQRMAALMR